MFVHVWVSNVLRNCSYVTFVAQKPFEALKLLICSTLVSWP